MTHTFVVHDYGETYEYEHFDVTFSEWGTIAISMETTPEDAPWFHAEYVECEVRTDFGVTYEFEGGVRTNYMYGTPEEPTVIYVDVFGTCYEVYEDG